MYVWQFVTSRVVQAWNHEAADRLYCEEIDVGEGEPRAIASGLREHCTLEEMQGRLVLVVCNLRPAKLAGFTSNGMVLAAKSADGKASAIGVVLYCGYGKLGGYACASVVLELMALQLELQCKVNPVVPFGYRYC